MWKDKPEAGGGEALAGWAYSAKVMGDDMTMAAEPMLLDDMGMATVMHTAMSVDDLPVEFALALDGVQGKDADGAPLDGGEEWMLVGENDDGYVMHEHDGLSLPGEMPADGGALEVRYTTQTLMVAVHQERDQVSGYTGNILGDDMHPSAEAATGISVQLLHIASGGRARAIEDLDPTSGSVRHVSIWRASR